MTQRIEWHVISPQDEVTRENGSAVLSIARNLVGEATRSGTASWIVAGRGAPAGVDRVLALLATRNLPTAAQALDRVWKFTTGRTAQRYLRTSELAGATSPTHVFLHNQPWMVHEFRSRFPQAVISLYLHNTVLNGLPSSVARRILSELDHVVCVSEFLRTDAISRLNATPPACHVVYSGIRDELFEPVHRPRDIDVVFVGRLCPEKGLHILLEALSLAKASGTALRCVVVGGRWFFGDLSSDYEKAMHALVNRRSLEVSFLGVLPPAEVPRVMGSAKVVVVPSVWPEPFGLTALEGMASGAAVVYSERGGLPEVVADGGVAVPAGSVRHLADALVALCSDESYRAGIAAAGLARAKRFDWSSAYERLRNVAT